MNLYTNLVSSLEKVFTSDAPDSFSPLSEITVFHGERLSFQLLVRFETEERQNPRLLPRITGDMASKIQMREVGQVPVAFAAYPNIKDDNYLRYDEGLYPDVLLPLGYGDRVALLPEKTKSIWFDLEIDDSIAEGEHALTVSLLNENGELLKNHTLCVTVHALTLPKLDMKLTQWFHYDCLAQYYHVPVWSEEHWRIIENFARTARRAGLNMILTPIHTPPLDTAVGGERLTTQLVDIRKEHEGYAFGFDKLDRFLTLMDTIGFEYFEIAHFFTQWGAEHAPKIVASVNGEEKKIFGWETEAAGEEYSSFLKAYIPAVIGHLKKRGMDQRAFFHISDEPTSCNYTSYVAAKSVVSELLKGYRVMDAASTLALYQNGIVDIPIPANNKIKPYLDAGVENLWTYYCCSQYKDVANNFIAMPAYRTRSIAEQFYQYNIVGFLHWGYNYYNTRYSISTVNPWLDTTAGHWVPAGDPFVVYPAGDGTPIESTRLLTFREALDDLRLFRLAEEKLGRECVLSEIKGIYGEISFDRCAKSSDTILKIRERIAEIL